ncbi:UNVERIFIED_ORG: pimeloyl-ACP methyl ester carboxylesterase [Xanthobacter viscosus]|jgi:pimeloyl-ACP methyl ester carboxylesterase|uniref:Alpha/beta hydrolase n=1 Tax=Xanthobacter autotrophicus TaxID=280 RepID=A0A6C1KT45_XANAU|nr:alpha/beta hydrolase [Xanthobacter autotrophicus]TLX42003.1 alpha/beta hydrolase [Xanthobacter autotrophicus]
MAMLKAGDINLRVQAGEVNLAWREWGEGDTIVLFLHGNLASKEWIELAAPHFPRGVRTIAIDWRGCGDSDKPEHLPDFSNYSIAQHADDMLAALDALGVSFCHLATHSTGGIISTRMILKQPERFGRVFSLSPVGPQGIVFRPEQAAFFGQMKASKELTRQVMASTAMSLFEPESLLHGPARFKPGVEARAGLFERIVDQTFAVSDGIWFGTPDTLTKEAASGELKARMGSIPHPHLVVWGMNDAVIAEADLKEMAALMPHCRFVAVPGVGHSLNLEAPELYAGYFGAWFGGLAR